ncbi:MAG: dockerin type I domain-containing protein, partial [Bacillota bacterium]|nr:dockerin type I domain-containing protein [Bacillota bacterium]
FVGPWMVDCGNSWRTTGDISDSWDSIMKNIDVNSKSAAYAGPGHWNDPDMLEVGNGKMTDTEYKAHFSMWCMMAAPLIAGNDLRNMTTATKDILTNKEVIAIDQDAAGVQGTKVNTSADLEVWCKPLGVDGATKAVILLNRGGAAADITVNWKDIKLANGPATVRDLWEHKDCGTFNTGYTANVPSHGAVVLKVQGSSTESVVTPTPIRPTPTATPQTSKISGYIAPDFTYTSQADSLVKQGFKVELEGKNLSAITDSAGYFEIYAPITTDSSILKFSKSGYLTRNRYASAVFSTQEHPFLLWAGDLNSDDVINMADIIEIAKAFNAVSTDSRYLISCDPNRDNTINMADVIIIAKHFGMTSKDYQVN